MAPRFLSSVVDGGKLSAPDPTVTVTVTKEIKRCLQMY
jgi:hypothetical protein